MVFVGFFVEMVVSCWVVGVVGEVVEEFDGYGYVVVVGVFVGVVVFVFVVFVELFVVVG